MDYRKRFIVEPGRKVRLAKIDPSYTGKHESHEKAAPQIRKHLERMGKLQYLLYADGDQSLLVVLQALEESIRRERSSSDSSNRARSRVHTISCGVSTCVLRRGARS